MAFASEQRRGSRASMVELVDRGKDSPVRSFFEAWTGETGEIQCG
jgi:hypothetical protein